MAKIVCALLCLTLANYAFGLECYQCAIGSDCFDLGNTKKIECGKTSVKGSEPYCMKKVLEDSQTNKQNITRTCVIADVRNPNQLCQHNDPKSKQIECKICNENLCNNSSKSTTNVFAVLGISIALFFTKRILY